MAKLVNQGSDEPGSRMIQLTKKVAATGGVIEGILLILIQQAAITETVGYLFIQFVTVGNDDHAGILDVLFNPLGQPDHCEGLAGALGVPDDTAILGPNAGDGRLQGEELIGTGNLFCASIVDDAVVDEVDEAIGLQHLQD